MEYGGKMTG